MKDYPMSSMRRICGSMLGREGGNMRVSFAWVGYLEESEVRKLWTRKLSANPLTSRRLVAVAATVSCDQFSAQLRPLLGWKPPPRDQRFLQLNCVGGLGATQSPLLFLCRESRTATTCKIWTVCGNIHVRQRDIPRSMESRGLAIKIHMSYM